MAIAQLTIIPFSVAFRKARYGFLHALRALLQVLTTVFLPHIAAAEAIFLLTAFALYQSAVVPMQLPSGIAILLALVLMVFYGALAFLYAVLASCVFAVRVVSGYAEDFLHDIFLALQEKVASKVESMDEGFAKDQAKLVIATSINEVFGIFRSYKLKSLPGAVAVVFISLLAFVTKSVFTARIMKMAGPTVNFTSVFASRATLIGALFLNLRLISTVLLVLLYGAGALLIGLNFLFVFVVK